MTLVSITNRLYTPGRYHSPLRLHMTTSRLLRYGDKKPAANFFLQRRCCSKIGRKFAYKLIYILKTYCEHKFAINQNIHELMKDIS